MSLDSLLIIEGEGIESAGSIAAYSYDNIFLNYAASKASLLTVQLRQSQTDLNTEHHNEKHALIALNERFHLFVEYVQRLEEQHDKYMAQLVSFVRHSYDISTIESKHKKEYVHLNTDLMALNNEKIDDETGYEMFQLQAAIYCQLIELEQYTKDKQCLKLEQELNKTSSILNTLRTSHANLQQEIKTVLALRSETLQQEFKLFNIEPVDGSKFWPLTYDECVKKIRHDFEWLYAKIHRKMIAFFELKMRDIKTDVEELLEYQKIEIEQLAKRIRQWESECEKMQKSLSYEKDLEMKLEATCSQLVSKFQMIQFENVEELEKQFKDISILKEKFTTIAYDIQQMQERNVNLEIEIILYRDLLGCTEKHKELIVSSSLSERSKARKWTIKGCTIGSIGIKDCPLDGDYISLINHSKTKNFDISKWVLTHQVDFEPIVKYKIPDGIQLQEDGEVIIYSIQGANVAKLLLTDHATSSLLHQKLILLFGDGKDNRLLKEQLISLRIQFKNTVEKDLDNLSGKQDKTNINDYSIWFSLTFRQQYYKYTISSIHEIKIPGQYTMFYSLRLLKNITKDGHNRNDYRFLVKAGEDIRQDQRIQGLFSVLNDLYDNDPNCNQSNSARISVPTDEDKSIIERLNNTCPLTEHIEECYTYAEHDIISQVQHSRTLCQD
ncbi:unnamed protein product [Rotaria sordida]|uniref:PI3K/PI4K catalytic domain-containing protein n=2 Tax=Rotaria sordida TaxID=392033 RepID=A0A814QH21_9BILA|nr:unnamed protein product [Rotaria sordida]